MFLVASAAAGYYLWRFGPALFERTGPRVAGLPAIDPEQVLIGRAAYATNCAQCHGQQAEGNPDWRTMQPDGTYLPPPHDSTGHTWHHSDGLLFRVIEEGGRMAYGSEGFNSQMPAFGDTLTDDEIRAVLDYFKSLWGPREREFQASVTEQEREM